MELITVGKNKMDLNDVEHNILRKKFDDPRIHFAINCASISCPQLLNEAYTANKLNMQLEEQARSFINDVSKNRLTAEKVWLSKIFLWFKGDFTQNKILIEFFNRSVTVLKRCIARASSVWTLIFEKDIGFWMNEKAP